MLRQPSHNTGLDISSTNLSTLIALITNLELNAVDAETLANILYLRSRHHAYSASSGSQPIYPMAVTYPSNPAALSGPSHEECSPPLSPSTSILADFPAPPVSICLTPPDSSDPTTVLVRGNSDRDAKPAIWLLPDCTYARIIIVTREMPLDCKGAPGISSHGLWPSGSSALHGTSSGPCDKQNAWSVAAAPNVRGLVPLTPLEGSELSGVVGVDPIWPIVQTSTFQPSSITSSGNSFSLTALGWGLLLSMRIQPVFYNWRNAWGIFVLDVRGLVLLTAVEGLELSVLVLTPQTTMKTARHFYCFLFPSARYSPDLTANRAEGSPTAGSVTAPVLMAIEGLMLSRACELSPGSPDLDLNLNVQVGLRLL
ncbi:hypothetical protein BKA83DRAFT_4125837 [Pisolithus microcarpus]|nr:hypothetical protein BKA83DRAFT_4125837 [Pisolithus microcarpus]